MKIGIIVFSVFATLSVTAQTVLVQYEQSANVENQIKNIKDEATRARVAKHLANPLYFSLLCKGNESIYTPSPSDLSSDNGKELPLGFEEDMKIITIGKGKGGIYKDREKKAYLSEENLLGKSFLVKDTLFDFDWKILSESKKIGKLNCTKATTTYNGEEIVAWFSREIPIFDGPRMFYGLPGLIVELHTLNLNFQVITIKEIGEQVEIQKPTKGKVVSLKQYEKIKTNRINALKQGQVFGN